MRFLLIDPKVVELSNYNGIPHLLAPVVTEPRQAASCLKWLVHEIERRYELFAWAGAKDISWFNRLFEELGRAAPGPSRPGEKSPRPGQRGGPPRAEGAGAGGAAAAAPVGATAPAGAAGPGGAAEAGGCPARARRRRWALCPYLVVVIDELADLMMQAAAEFEASICRIAQLARATGIHLVVATQRPSVNVITGTIKANIPSRIAFAVASQVDSRTILDMNGAERLVGQGDMLYLPVDASKPAAHPGRLRLRPRG